MAIGVTDPMRPLSGRHGRLSARPPKVAPTAAQASGLGRMTVADREALVLVPEGYAPGRPVPLLVALHGAAHDANSILSPLSEAARKLGVLLLAPKSKGITWDAIHGADFGPDVAFLNEALKRLFAAYAIDRNRIAVGGFSDGASYALSLGLANGDLFDDVLAFSPGFAFAPETHGHPRVFISHGRRDPVLPIAQCGRAIARELAQAHYSVAFKEFDGVHEMPAEVVEAAVRGFSERGARQPG
jgi:predicted esterase